MWGAVIAAIISALAGAGTAYASNRSQNQQIEAANEAERRERFRQAEMQRQADSRLRDGLQQFTPEQHDQQLQQAAASREAAMQPAAPAQDVYQAAPSTAAAPVEVKSDLSRRFGDVVASARDVAKRRATLEAYGDASLGQSFQMNRLGEEVRRSGDASRRSSSIYPYELSRDVSTAGANSRAAANVANVIGNIGSMYANRRWPGAAPGMGYGAASNPAALGQTTGPY
jgi:hypothetical protein